MKPVSLILVIITCLSLFSCQKIQSDGVSVTEKETNSRETAEILNNNDITAYNDRLYAVDFYVGSDNACIVKLIDFTETDRKEENGKTIRRGISTFQVKYVLKGNHRVDEIIQTEDIKNAPERATQFLENNYMITEHDSYHVEIYSAEIGKYYYYFDTPETVTNDETQFKYHADQMISAVSMELPAALKFSDEDENSCLNFLYGYDSLKMIHESEMGWDARKDGTSSNLKYNIKYYQYHDEIMEEFWRLYRIRFDVELDGRIGKVFLGIPIEEVKSKTLNAAGFHLAVYTYRAEVVQPFLNNNLQKGITIEFDSLIDYYEVMDYDNHYERFFDEETADRYNKSSPVCMIAYDIKIIPKTL